MTDDTAQLGELGDAAFGQIFFFLFSFARYARLAGEMCPRERGIATATPPLLTRRAHVTVSSG